jgi:acyl-CoA dehydrogenase
MAEMINLSRLYNAVASIAVMRRAIVEAVAHAATRTAFGRRVIEFPLMQRTLADLIVEQQAAFQIVFEAVRLIDLIDSGKGDKNTELDLRLITPLIKYYTGKQAVWTVSEAMEVLGGNGYIEEFVTARLLRDAQVLPIWEGTTNILTLDALRAMNKEAAHRPLIAAMQTKLRSLSLPEPTLRLLETAWERVTSHIESLLSSKATFNAKDVTDELVRIVQATLLLASGEDKVAQAQANYFISKHFGGGADAALAEIIVNSESESINGIK